MNLNITYHIATEKDYPAILLLYNEMYKSDRSLDNFNWLVEMNPAGRAILFIAKLEGRVVGMQSLIPYQFVKNGESINTYKSEDTLVEKNLRGQGIFSKLYKMLHAHAGSKLVWGLTDKKEILERVDMPSSRRLTIAISVKKPSLIPDKKGLHRYVAKTLFYSYLYFKSTFKVKKVQAGLRQAVIDSTAYGNQKLQSFFGILSTQNPNLLFPVMDSVYLDWRLTNNPNLEKYKIEVSYLEDGSIAMCSIIGIDEKSAYWQAFYSLSNISINEKITHVLTIRKKLFDSGINLVHSWLFECNTNVKEVKELFYEAGFSKVRDGLWIVHNSTDKEINVHDLYFSPLLGIR